MQNKQKRGPLGRMNNKSTQRAKTRIGGQTMADQINVANRVVGPSYTSNGSGDVDTFISLDPALSGNGPLTNVARCYQEYKGTRISCSWQPNVGFTTSGIVYIGYLDNPELCQKWSTISWTDKQAIVKSLPNARSANVYEPLTVSVNVPLRRKWFTCDMAVAANAEAVDRSIQGMWVLIVLGSAVTTTLGCAVLNETYVLKGLVNPLATTYTKLTTGDEPMTSRFPTTHVPRGDPEERLG